MTTFLLRKEIERKLFNLFPNDWIPLYSMVTFSNIPYAEAQRIGKIQQTIMDEVLKKPNLENEWEALDFQKIVTTLKERAGLT